MPVRVLLSPTENTDTILLKARIVASGLSDGMLGWMAGVTDGEGCVFIEKQLIQRRVTPNYVVGVSIAATKYDLTPFARHFGGRIRLLKHEDIRHADQFKWEIRDNKALLFLIVISPYLQWKKEQAELATQLQVEKMIRGKSTRGIVPPETVEKRENLYQQVRFLNKKGR